MTARSKRVITLDDGRRVMDPWDALQNYMDRYGLEEAFDDDPIVVIDDWNSFLTAEEMTGDLFATEEAR